MEGLVVHVQIYRSRQLFASAALDYRSLNKQERLERFEFKQIHIKREAEKTRQMLYFFLHFVHHKFKCTLFFLPELKYNKASMVYPNSSISSNASNHPNLDLIIRK